MSRKGTYVSRGERDAFESLSAKLVADLRSHVRYMADYPVLSDDWIQMADQVMRIGEITEMERQLPKAKDATLWECEEVALRYLLEDGKLNLCLRNLVDFNDYLKKLISRGPIKDTTQQVLDKFEQGMGLTLKNAWLHAEAVQTTDLPLLVQYIDDILSYSLDNPMYFADKKLTNSQEITVIHFLFGLLKQLETIDESRIMPLLVEKRIFAHLAMHLSAIGTRLPADHMNTGIETLALICATEDFQSHSDQYLDSMEAETALLSLKDDFLDEATKDVDTRKRLRPLLDAIQHIHRTRK